MNPAHRAILFFHVPCFYAAIERAADPELRTRPVIVGGDPRKRGQVQSASPDALAAGVRIGMSMLEALDRCPRARAVRTDMKRYREVSGLLRAILRDPARRRQAAADEEASQPSGNDALGIEPMGLDGAFLDATSDARDPVAIAHALRARVREELRLDSRVGLASVKFLARIAAEQAGDEGVLRVEPGKEARFLAPLPTAVLPGVGPKTLAALHALGIERVGDLQQADRDALERELGNHGLRILELARGEDAQPVRAARTPRTLSQEQSFELPQLDLAVLSETLAQLATGLESALRRQGLGARRIAVKVRYDDHETASRSRTLAQPLRAAGEILEVALQLLERTHAGTRGVRGIGVSLAALRASGDEDRQLDLFGPSA